MSLQHPGAAFEKARDPLSGCLVFPGDGHLKPCLSCMALAQLALAHSEPALCINNMQIQQLGDCGIELSRGMSATLNMLLMAVHDKRAHIKSSLLHPIQHTSASPSDTGRPVRACEIAAFAFLDSWKPCTSTHDRSAEAVA